MKQAKEIALAFPRGAHQEVFIDGVIQYASDRGYNWSYVTAPESLALSVLDLRGWRGDGVIAALNTPAEAAYVKDWGIPTVNISGALVETPVPRIGVDNRMVGEQAADHLIERGFQQFAHYGLKSVAYSTIRREAFDARLKVAGFSCESLLMPPTYRARGLHWRDQQGKLVTWLHGLPKPIGLFAVTDYRARQVLDACRQVPLRVPQQLAVIGVDNEEVICAHVRPQLSSVGRNNQQEGYHAASVLDRLIRGKPAIKKEETIPPLGVVARGSTETVAFEDLRLCNAIDFVNGHIEEPIGVQEVVSHIGASRRWLEYAFRDALGESPYQYIRSRRLKLARRLLEEEPTAKLYEVARRTGFSSAKQFSTAFCQIYGVSPRDFQRSKGSKSRDVRI